jgi:hypothetical protein
VLELFIVIGIAVGIVLEGMFASRPSQPGAQEHGTGPLVVALTTAQLVVG